MPRLHSAFATGASTRIHDLRNVMHRARCTTRPLVDHQPIHDVKEPNGKMLHVEHEHRAWIFLSSDGGVGGAGRDRTDDLKLAKLPLSQLSYGPVSTQHPEADLQTNLNHGGPGKI